MRALLNLKSANLHRSVEEYHSVPSGPRSLKLIPYRFVNR
jgi:hypothetical protein